MSRLKHCPFCGSEADTAYNTRFNYQAFCTNDDCFMSTIVMYGMATEEDAIREWNKRADDKRPTITSEPHIITEDDFSRCDDFGYIPAVFEPRDMSTFVNWEWSLICEAAVHDHRNGRYWSGVPTVEQAEVVKRDG